MARVRGDSDRRRHAQSLLPDVKGGQAQAVEETGCTVAAMLMLRLDDWSSVPVLMTSQSQLNGGRDGRRDMGYSVPPTGTGRDSNLKMEKVGRVLLSELLAVTLGTARTAGDAHTHCARLAARA